MARVGHVFVISGLHSRSHGPDWVDTSQPPTGRVTTAEGQPAQPFVGSLQLLAILARALQPDGTDGEGPALGPSEAVPELPG